MVDAHSIVLRPGARERVRLRLCATTCGTLRITGARWRLFGEVGGMHQLVRPGPLLHASREQRATARAPRTCRSLFMLSGTCRGSRRVPGYAGDYASGRGRPRIATARESWPRASW